VKAIDDPEGTRYEIAPRDITVGIQRRFENRPVVIHPTRPGVFIYDPGNFWDGPIHVMWEPDEGMFWFDGWNGTEHFPLVGPLH
jgi:hypothetical protein